MPNRILLAAARNPRIERFITSHRSTRAVAYRFVAGDRLEDAVAVLGHLERAGIGGILDHLGENVSDERQAEAALSAYLESIDRIRDPFPDAHVSVKLTQLGLDLSQENCTERMRQICASAASIGTFVAIDMESHEYTDRTIQVYRSLRETYDDVVLCLQAYLTRTLDDIKGLLDLRPRIRLCKGAYKEPRSISYSRGRTLESYVSALELLLPDSPSTAIATHDDRLIQSAIQISKRTGSDIEFQMLYGVRPKLQRALVEEGHRLRVYIPFGDQWYPYLMRRLAERPANLRFFVESLIRK